MLGSPETVQGRSTMGARAPMFTAAEPGNSAARWSPDSAHQPHPQQVLESEGVPEESRSWLFTCAALGAEFTSHIPRALRSHAPA